MSSNHDTLPVPSKELRTPPAKIRRGPDGHSFGSSVNENNHTRQFRIPDRKRRRNARIYTTLCCINQDNEILMEVQDKLFVDDDDGHLNFDINDTIDKYNLLGFLGKGTFGRVAKARNLDTCQIVALKIAGSSEGCPESARNEILILKRLRERDPEGKYLWVQMLDHFEFQGHVCIAFEKLGDSLYTFLRENKYQPYQVSQIRHIVYQLCYSVKALHDNMIVHTDLKPENICLVSSDFTYGIRATRQLTYRKPISTNIKLIDFGSAVDFLDDDEIDEDVTIQTRYYRAPENVFKLHWNQAVDVWSIGCILFELYTGECLFMGDDNDDEHYQVMLDVLGPFPDLYLSTKLAEKHKVIAPENKIKRRKPLRKWIKMSAREHQDLFDLMEKMLKYNPKERISLTDALKHPFFLLLSDDQKFKY